MSNAPDSIPEDLKYSTEHQWLRLEGDIARVGITGYAQDELGDIVYVVLPKPGDSVSFMQQLGEIESMKVTSVLYSPATGVVVEVNRALEDTPEIVNRDPYGEGWLLTVRLTDAAELDQLLDPNGYRALVHGGAGSA